MPSGSRGDQSTSKWGSHPDHNVISRRNHEITNQQIYFSPELHQDSLERPLLYTVVVRNDESYGNDFFKPNERQRARRVLLTIPAERESVRGGSRATNANGEGTIRGVVTAVTEVAMAVRRAIE